jgi:hypothetical protein
LGFGLVMAPRFVRSDAGIMPPPNVFAAGSALAVSLSPSPGPALSFGVLGSESGFGASPAGADMTTSAPGPFDSA